ncbi:MAG: DUF2917 domain-containing protein [Anaerolineae bacterium]|nr:DUF2917 domain-containing protein [Anaerolineae bacterium]
MSAMNISMGRRFTLRRTNEQEHTVEHGQTLVLKAKGQELRVRSGLAWVSFDGEDHILRSGQTVTLARGGDAWAIVSGLGNADAVVVVSEA